MTSIAAGLICAVLIVAIPADMSGQDLPPRAQLSVFSYDKSAPLDVRYVADDTARGYHVQDLSYASPGGGRVPGFLYTPLGDGPFAGIVLLHGMPGNRHNSTWLAERLARTGAVVLAITAPFARPEDRPRERPITLTATDRVEQIQLIQDLQRAVDLLEQYPKVDSERLGLQRRELWAAMGGLFAGVERRLRAYALWVGDGGLVAHVTGEDDRDGRFAQLPRESQEAWLQLMLPIEPIRFVGLAAPARLLFQSARRDRAVMAADAARFSAAGSMPKDVRWYDMGHGLNDTAFGEQARWLADQLGLDFSQWH